MSLLTIAEAADKLRVSVRTLEREALDGRLAIVRVRSRRLVDSAELERYVAAQTVCQSGGRETAGKYASVLAAARAWKNAYLQVPPAPTRSRSKMRSGASKSRMQLVKSEG